MNYKHKAINLANVSYYALNLRVVTMLYNGNGGSRIYFRSYVCNKRILQLLN